MANWLEQVDVTLANTEEVSFDTLQELLETGNSLPQKTGIQVCLQPLKLLSQRYISRHCGVQNQNLSFVFCTIISFSTAIEKAVSELRGLVALGERWEEKAKLCLQAR